jgi:hypothetical protein
MPLVTIVSAPSWGRPSGYTTALDEQRLLKRMAHELPHAFTLNERKLGLDMGTPPEAVQIRFEQFGQEDVNCPDIWMLVQLTEPPPGEDLQLQARETLEEILEGFVAELKHRAEPTRALDVFWGPGRGYIRGPNSQTIHW